MVTWSLILYQNEYRCVYGFDAICGTVRLTFYNDNLASIKSRADGQMQIGLLNKRQDLASGLLGDTAPANTWTSISGINLISSTIYELKKSKRKNKFTEIYSILSPYIYSRNS
jgi:hypothetical protein